MTRLFVWLLLALLLILAALAVFAFYGETLRPSARQVAFAGQCAPMQGVGGAEDLQIDPEKRRAYVSSFSSGSDKPRGAIIAFSVDDPLADDAWSDRTGGEPEVFRPLGLDLYDRDGVRRLFVVNAAAKSVELYDVGDSGALKHLETFVERRMRSPNDVVAVGPRAFYVSNDIEPGRRGVLARLRALIPVGTGSILYFNGVSWRLSAENLRFVNGLGANRDGSRLYVAETGAGALRIYDRDLATGALRLARTVIAGAAIDNINIDATGELWLAAHAYAPGLALTEPKAAKLPSLVLRYNDVEGAKTKPIGVYSSDGAEISASTAAARIGSTLLIGGLLEKKLLICTLPTSVARR